MKYLESQVFTLTVANVDHFVEFKVQSLPNDMKMLAFLAGEHTNSATYFTTFANVAQKNVSDITKSFSVDDKNSSWRPFSFENRIADTKLVSKKKLDLSKKKIKQTTLLQHLTNYISNQLNSRQEKEPLVGKYTDLVLCEPLHLKNNISKEMFMKILKIVITEANISNDIKLFKELPDTNLFVTFINLLKIMLL